MASEANKNYKSNLSPELPPLLIFFKIVSFILLTNIFCILRDHYLNYKTKFLLILADIFVLSYFLSLFSFTQSSNFKKLICFLYSLPYSNADIESTFSQMKFLLNDRRNCMTTKLISA